MGAMTIRDQFNEFVDRHDVAWEVVMAALALVWVAIGFVIDQVGEGLRPDLELVELLLTSVFVVEFVTRLAYLAHVASP